MHPCHLQTSPRHDSKLPPSFCSFLHRPPQSPFPPPTPDPATMQPGGFPRRPVKRKFKSLHPRKALHSLPPNAAPPAAAAAPRAASQPVPRPASQAAPAAAPAASPSPAAPPAPAPVPRPAPACCVCRWWCKCVLELPLCKYAHWVGLVYAGWGVREQAMALRHEALLVALRSDWPGACRGGALSFTPTALLLSGGDIRV